MVKPWIYALICLAVHLMPAPWIRSLRVEVYMRKERLLDREARLTVVCACKAFLEASNNEMLRRRSRRAA